LAFEFWKAVPYLEVFYARTKAHDKEAARKAIDKALSLASECPDKFSASRIYMLVSWKLISTGEKAEAKDIIQRVTATCAQISDPAERDTLYRGVASLKVKINDIQGSMEAAARIANDKDRDSAYVAILEAMITVRDVPGAKEIAKRISSFYEKRLACDKIAYLLEALGHFNESIAMTSLSSSLLHHKDYSEIDEFGFWSELVDKYFGKPPLADLKGYIAVLKDRNPCDQVADLAKAAQEMAWAFKELRDEAGKWQAYRSLR